VPLPEVQNPGFWIDKEFGNAPLTLSAVDGKRLAEVLERHAGDGIGAALKIRTAMELGGSAQVEEFAIGEDVAVINALEELQQTGDFRDPLPRLLCELKKKLDRENV
jgi:hypothetical protein